MRPASTIPTPVRRSPKISASADPLERLVSLLPRYSAPVPLYTSYPTALQFKPFIDESTYRGWLSGIPAGEALSIYLHVPFCPQLCWFCGSDTSVVNSYGPIRSYAADLMREIDLVSSGLADCRVRHLHFGGGNPTMLSSDDFRSIVARLVHHFQFDESAEIGIDIDPRGLDHDRIRRLVVCGINHASIGVQDFDGRVQAAINRIQGFDETRSVVESLRESGVASINIDLMYGLPGQTVSGVQKTAAQVVSLSPDRVAVFGYAHVPKLKAHQRLLNPELIPSAELRLRQSLAIADCLTQAGYVRIGLGHFAKSDDRLARSTAPGGLHRNFLGYTADDAPILIGFGPSAISSLAQGYAQNLSDPRRYREAIAAGRLPIDRGLALTAEDRLRRAVIERIMCDLEVDFGAQARAHGLPQLTFDRERIRLAALAADGVIEIDETRCRVPAIMRPFIRSVASVFDSYLNPGDVDYSMGV